MIKLYVDPRGGATRRHDDDRYRLQAFSDAMIGTVAHQFTKFQQV